MWTCSVRGSQAGQIRTPASKIGNIARPGDPGSFDEKAYGQWVEKSLEDNRARIEGCRGCEAGGICSYGCPAFDSEDAETALNMCEAQKMLFRSYQDLDPADVAAVVRAGRSGFKRSGE